jgi:hypothetical protein
LIPRTRLRSGVVAAGAEARAPLAKEAAAPALSAVTAAAVTLWQDAATAIAEGPIAARLIAEVIILTAERRSGPRR